MKKLILCSLLTTLTATQTWAEDSPVPTQPSTTPPPIATPDTTAQPTGEKPAEATPPAMDCNYKIPAKVTVIEQPLILAWAKNATLQSFNFEVVSLDKQMAELKNCYTEQGWQGFHDALQKSGNLESIKTQKLAVSSQLHGEPTFIESKDNFWKVSLPLQVTYQNSKDKITQNLNVALTIGRKPSGDLGIMQMVAEVPKNTEANQPNAETPKPAETTAPAN